MSAENLVANRRELHGSISPAVYSKHARVELIHDIQHLPFPEETFINPLSLANCPIIVKALEIDRMVADEMAQSNGIKEFTDACNVFHSGYGDRHFTSVAAGSLGLGFSEKLRLNDLIDTPLTLMDYGKMFQTGWFGQVANQLALTTNGFLQSAFRHQNGIKELHERLDLDEVSSILGLDTEPKSGLLIGVLTHDAKVALRVVMDRSRTVGCPVARTTFTAKTEQIEFLREFGHLEEPGKLPSGSGFYVEGALSISGLVKVSQDTNTAIDDVLWYWGDYLLRYGGNLLDRGVNPELIEPTKVNEVLLIDYPEQ